jgi:hypothetical protein
MTNSHTHTQPSPKQLNYLRDLAISRGETFAVPRSSAEASREIERLRSRRPSNVVERAIERADGREVADRWAPATDVRPFEVSGYGSSARWAR